MGSCSANFGSANTNNYYFGNAELRISTLSDAMNQTSAHSVGIVTDAAINFTQERNELQGGVGNATLASAVSSSSLQVTATLPEITYRNLEIALGNGVPTISADKVATTATVASAAAVLLPVDDATGILAGDFIQILNPTDAAQVQIARVASVSTNDLTLDAGTPLLFDTTTSHIVRKQYVSSIGACSGNFLSVMLMQRNSKDGNPRVFYGWYGEATAGINQNISSTEWANIPMTLTFYQVPATLIAASGDLNHLANIIPSAPFGQMMSDSDA